MTAVPISLFDQAPHGGSSRQDSPPPAAAPPRELPLDAPVRLSDPDTSVDAAQSIEEAAANDRALVLDALERHGGRGSADQITAWLNAEGDRTWQRNCVSSRCSQLLRRGLIADSGERGKGATGRPVIVFVVVR